MCELWRDLHSAVETGRQWSLSLQRLWPLLQDERPEQAAHQTQAETGEFTVYMRGPKDFPLVKTEP